MPALVNTYRKIANWGLDKVESPTLHKQVLLANQLALLAFVFCVIGWPYGFISQDWPLAICDTITVFGMVSVLVFNRFGFYTASRVAMILTANFGLVATSIFLGFESGTDFIFVAAVALPFILFRDWPLRHYLLASIIPVGSFMYLRAYGYGHLAHLRKPAPEWYFWMQIVAAFTLNSFGYYHFNRAHRRVEDKLAKSLEDLKSEEQKRLQVSKMSAMGEIAAGIAHEINNPLTIISGHVFKMRHHLGPKSDANKVAYDSLDSIQRTVQRVAKIIKGLLAFVRNVDDDPFDRIPLNILVSDALELCEARITRQSIDLIIDIPSDCQINCRPTQIVQVLLNLLNNAYDAISNDPSEKWIRVKAEVAANHVLITVTDSGRGIPDAIAEKILQPFFTTKDVGKGTGLGLSISIGLIEDHNGRLFYNKNCPNTQFVIELPLA